MTKPSHSRIPGLSVLGKVATLIGLVTLASAVLAGRYVQIQGSAGQYGGQAISNIYNPDPSYKNGSEGYGGVAGGSGRPGIATCSGAITTKFQWVGTTEDELPPEYVLVTEWCEAKYNCTSNPSAPSGSCDNGLGHPAVTQAGPVYGSGGTIVWYGASGTSRGTRYSIKNGADVITLSLSPSAEANAPSGAMSAAVWYRASVSPIQIVFDDGIGPQSFRRYLIGQVVTTHLESGGLSPSNFSWSVAGVDPFKLWSADRNATVYLPSVLGSGSSYTFHGRKPGPYTVNVTAHLDVPSGALPSGGLDVQVARTCNAEKPYNSLTVTMGQPTISNDGILKLDGAHLPQYSGSYGTLWLNQVTTPSEYGSGGTWQFVQTIVPHRLIRDTSYVDHIWIFDRLHGLDVEYPYNFMTYPADGGEYYRGDQPAHGPADESKYIYSEVFDSFETYSLYSPPGTGSMYVPLKGWPWYWKAQAYRIDDGYGGYDWAMTDPEAAFSFEDFPFHPLWDRNIADGKIWTPPLP